VHDAGGYIHCLYPVAQHLGVIHLGELADPHSGAKNKDLILAKHAIDTLGMLQEKTKGNLSDDEKKTLENILYDSRLRYVNACR